MMYRNLLVATDGSERADRAVAHGLDLAAKHDATVHVIHVVDTTHENEPALSSTEIVLDDLEDRGWEYVSEIERLGADQGVDVVTEICHGRPGPEILRYADEADVDVLVLGFTGDAHPKTENIGHVSEHVVRRAGRPVLLV